MKSIRVLFLLLAVGLLFNTLVQGQAWPAPTVAVKCVVDGSSIQPTSFMFDVLIKRTGTQEYDYVKGQYAFSYNTAIRPGGNGGTWTLQIMASDLPSPKRCVITSTSTSTNGVFVLWGPPDNTDEYLVSSTTDVLVARVKATLSVPFEIQPLNLVWRTALPNPFTKLYYNDHASKTVIGVPAGNLSYEMIGGNIPLPVELKSLTAAGQGRDVELNWTTKTEVNTSKFLVERASSSTTPIWVNVGEVAASGNSNSEKQYSFVDKKLQSGKYSYRLKIVDADGSYRYSDIVEAEVSLPKEYAISQNYPNPFNPSTRIDYQLPFDSKVTIELYGITGEKVATILNNEQAAGYYTADINAGQLNLASGVYIYRMNANNQSGQSFVQVKKLMLTK